MDFWLKLQDLHKKNILTNGEYHIFEQIKVIEIGFGTK